MDNMEKHIQALGIANIVLGCLGIFGALVVLAIFGGGGLFASEASGEPEFAIIGLAFGSLLALIILLFSIPSFICGIALLKRWSWGHGAGLVISFINLLHIPFGTAVGIYGLWVVFQPETQDLFRSGDQPS